MLAQALRSCHDDYREAFTRYEQQLKSFLMRKQVAAARFASSFVPKTSIGISFRNVVTELLRIPSIANVVIGRNLRDDINLDQPPC